MDLNSIRSINIEKYLTPVMPVIAKILPYDKVVYAVIGVGTLASIIHRFVLGYGFFSAFFTPLLFSVGIFCLFFPLSKKYKEHQHFTDRVDAVVAEIKTGYVGASIPNCPVYEYTFDGRTYRTNSKSKNELHFNIGDRVTLLLFASDPTDILELEGEDPFSKNMMLGRVVSLAAGLLFWLISLIAH